MIGKFYSDYHEARDAAGQLVNKLSMNVRLRKVCEPGNRKGYVMNLVPSLSKCFGRDLEGELVEPMHGRKVATEAAECYDQNER